MALIRQSPHTMAGHFVSKVAGLKAQDLGSLWRPDSEI